MRPSPASTVNVARSEAAFWSTFLRNRNVDAGTAADGAVAVAGGYALCLVGTFLEHGVAIGSTRPVRPDDLAVLRAFYARRGLPPRLELDQDVLERDRPVLTSAGYLLDELVLTVLSAPTAPSSGTGTGTDGVLVRLVTNRRAWSELVMRGFKDTLPESEHERLRRATESSAAAAHGLFVAAIDGVDVGGGAVGINGELAFLYSASVLPAYRNRGVHRALLAARLAFGHARGATDAALKTVPASAVLRSSAALGFTPLSIRRRLRALN
jgi:GNAT superfamily N-acetyltransferase